ncbi:MAG: trigger factor [bacterium]|nr:trigger factor [bacterium]
MYTYKLNKLPKSTTEILLNIPKADVAKDYEIAFKKLSDELTVEGFRKGKAPKSVAEKHLAKETVYEELLKTLLSRIYEELVKKEGLTPIMNPKVDLVNVKDGVDWEVKITIAEKAKITLGDYKETVKKVKANQKKDEIWVPGKDKPAEKKPEENRQKLMNEILSALMKEVQIELSDLIVDEELNQKLARLVDDVQKIGLTTEAYLKSKNLTMEEIKKRYKQEIEDTYKIEFMLMEIADKEGIKVEQADLEKLFANIKDEKERQNAAQNAYFYASVLRKQKTLDYLLGL